VGNRTHARVPSPLTGLGAPEAYGWADRGERRGGRDEVVAKLVAVQGGVAVALAAVWLGMVILAYAVARNPSSGVTFGEAPEVMLRVPIASMRFQAGTLELRAGQPTAIFLTNSDAVPHSFEVDALNIHVNVPAGTTAVALLKAPSAGPIPFYCAVPGHKEAGMVGTLNVR
jgi:uncharacterized cupredoxin-like copper-binding protein